MKLWLGDIAPGTSDEEITELVKKYAPDLTCASIERVEGTGSRPGAMLEFSGGGMEALDKLSQRLSGMYWKDRSLVCQNLAR